MDDAARRLVHAWLNKARHDLDKACCVVEHVEPITDMAVTLPAVGGGKVLKAVADKFYQQASIN